MRRRVSNHIQLYRKKKRPNLRAEAKGRKEGWRLESFGCAQRRQRRARGRRGQRRGSGRTAELRGSRAAGNAIMSAWEAAGGGWRCEEATAGGAGTRQLRPTVFGWSLRGLTGVHAVQCRSFGCSEAATAGRTSGDGRGRESERAGTKRVYVTLVSVAMRRSSSSSAPPLPPRGDVGRSF